MKVIKKKGLFIRTFGLGTDLEMTDHYLKKGVLRKRAGDVYEVFSKEAINGTGQLARIGDYVKIDTAGDLYPNSREYFLENHRQIGEHIYEQIPKELSVWTNEEDMCEEIEFLIQNKGLVINKESEEKYYTAPLWGATLSAARDAVIIFYKIDKDESGSIRDIDFNFVERKEFEKTYCIIEE